MLIKDKIPQLSDTTWNLIIRFLGWELSWIIHSTLFMVLRIDRLKCVNTMGCEIFGLELTDPKSTYQLLYWYCLRIKDTNKRVITFLLMLLSRLESSSWLLIHWSINLCLYSDAIMLEHRQSNLKIPEGKKSAQAFGLWR